MQVQVNSNHTIRTDESFERWATKELNEALSRFKDEITRVEVHMSVDTGDKPSADIKRCVMEARLARHEPLVVNHHALSQDEAFRGACDKLNRLIEHTLGKLRDQHRARKSIRREVDPGED